MNRIQRECECFLTDRAAKMPPMKTCRSLPLTTLNRPDAHQEIVDRYSRYSQEYWAGVKVRQLAYLRDLRGETTFSCNASVYRPSNEAPIQEEEKTIIQASAELISAVRKPEVVIPKEVETVVLSCNNCLKK
jgi:hypothetical protein